jgi:tetratricopeptide (TPR) repeat protein
MAADRPLDAVMELSAIVDDPASPEQARLLLEAIYSKAGNFAALASFYGRMIKQYPDNLRWKMKAALLAMRAKNFAAAESIYELVWNTGVERDEPDPSALEGYIKALIGGEKLQESMDVCSKYVNTEFKTVALVGMALTKWEMKDRPAAVEYFRMAADSAQDSPTTATDILNVMNNVIGPDEVEKYCQEKLAEDADSLVANYVLYHLSMITGDYNKAIAFLDKCIVISESDSENAINFMAKKGNLLARAYKKYSDKRHLDEAVTTWKYLLEKFPKNARLLNNIAYLLAEDGRELDLASEYAKRAVEASPDNPDSLDTYAYVLYKNNRFEEAAEQAHASLQQYEALQAYAPAEVYQHLGMIMEELGKKNEAIDAYEKALELGDNSISQEGIEQINEALRRLGN